MSLSRSSAPIAVMAALAVGVATAGAVTIAKPNTTSSQAGVTPKPVLIETVVTFPESGPARGTVQRLFIGQRALCRRAPFEDRGSGPFVIKRIDCGRSGDLTIRFRPAPHGPGVRHQSSSWTLIEATGSFRRLAGGGTVFVRSTGERTAREIFTGTLR